MTQRRRLDEFLARKAAEAGAEFRDGVSVAFDDGDVRRRRRARCTRDVIVGADGVNGITARAFGLGRDHGHGVALEGNAPLDARYRGKLVLELGVVPGGYALGLSEGRPRELRRRRLGERGAAAPRSPAASLRRARRRLRRAHGSARLPAAVSQRRRRASPATTSLLVGDAAGLVDPLTGDGMYEAFVSGKARRGGDSRRRPRRRTSRACSRELGRCTGASWSAKHALDRFPRLTFGIARLPFAWPVIARIVRGDLKDPAKARGLSRAPLKALDRLGKLAAPARG